MLEFISSLCSPHAQDTISWLDVTLTNQSGSKVCNGICSKMLTGSGKNVQVKQTSSSIPSTTGGLKWADPWG